MDIGFILLACAVIVLSAGAAKPVGWAALTLAVVALLVRLVWALR
jgi:hypothetical protein